MGEIVNTALSSEHVADVRMIEALVDELAGKLYTDHGYISKGLKAALAKQSVLPDVWLGFIMHCWLISYAISISQPFKILMNYLKHD